MAQANSLRRLIFALAAAACFSSGMPDAIQYSSFSDDREIFAEYIISAAPFSSKIRQISGGIVSHHLFAGEHIARFFNTIRCNSKKNKRRTFIIIGPNHASRGSALISTSARAWKTPFGLCRPDLHIVNRLCQEGRASISEDVFPGEHSIGALMPFIAHYFPESKVVPLLINFRITWEESRRLGAAIAAACGQCDILILSADFVHGERNDIAQTLDKKAESVLTHFQEDQSEETIKKVAVDCRKGLLSLFAYLDARNAGDCEILLNTNSAILAKQDVPATSYFFVLYGNR